MTQTAHTICKHYITDSLTRHEFPSLHAISSRHKESHLQLARHNENAGGDGTPQRSANSLMTPLLRGHLRHRGRVFCHRARLRPLARERAGASD